MAEEKQIQKFQESTMEMVLKKVNDFTETGNLHLPADYSLPNALRGAWLQLQEGDILQSCTKESIANSLLDMATQGLSVAKRQGAFIKYGNKVVFQREYAGNVALAKRYAGMKDVRGNVIYNDDVFKFGVNADTGRKYIIQHTQEVSNIDPAKIIGAYALVMMESGDTFLEVMSMQQIKSSWEMGASKGNSPAHRNFPDQMCVKTVINRALKILISSSDDSVLMENVETNRKMDDFKSEVAENANKGAVIDIPDEPMQDAVEVKEEQPAPPAEQPKGRTAKAEQTKAPF